MLMASGWSESEIEDFIPEDALLEFADACPATTSQIVYLKLSVDDNGNTFVEQMDHATCLAEVNEAKQQREIALQRELAGISTASIDEVTTSDGYMVYFVQALQSEAGSDVYVLSARYEWLIEPKNRDIDVFGLGHCEQLTQLGNSGSVYYRYKADIYGNIRKKNAVEKLCS